MAARKVAAGDKVDQMLQSLFVLARTVEFVLGSKAAVAGAETSLSASKLQVLQLLGQRGEAGATYMAHFLGVSKPAVSQLMEGMVREGLVTRATPRHDRREVALSLTRKGRTLYQRVRRRQRHYLRRLMNVSRKPSFDQWMRTLNQISRSLAQTDKSLSLFCAQCGAYNAGPCLLAGGEAVCPHLERAGGGRV